MKSFINEKMEALEVIFKFAQSLPYQKLHTKSINQYFIELCEQWYYNNDKFAKWFIYALYKVH